MQILDPEAKNRPGANRTAIRKALSTPETISEMAAQLQERRLVGRFFLQPETAALIARLHFGEKVRA